MEKIPKVFCSRFSSVVMMMMGWSLVLRVVPVEGIRFVVHKKECFKHLIEYDYDTVFASFVVLRADNPWSVSRVGVDLTVEGPLGQRYYTGVAKESDKFEFVAPKKGHYSFCFNNQSPIHETIDFDVHIGHVPKQDQELAKSEHFTPLLAQISRIEEALYSVQFEQHWLAAQTAHQAIVNEAMSKRVVYKALLESIAMIAASLLQVYLLQRLFEKKLINASRV